MREAMPSVLVPGLNCSPALYSEQVPTLWQFGPVQIADHTRDDSIAAIAARILDAAPRHFALVGLSMGGYIAFEMLQQAPERVEKLALLDTGARADAPEQCERRLRLIALAEGGRFHEVPDLLFPLFVHRNRHGDVKLKEIVRRMAEETGAQAFVRQQRALMSRPDARPGLPAIRVPTLVLVGEGDELTPPALSQEIATGIPGARLVTVPDSGHLSTLERPAAVNKALVEWMSG